MESGSDSAVGRRRRHFHRRRRFRRDDRGASARQDADHAGAARHRHRERRRPRRARSSARRGCSCTAPPSRSTPSWSAPARTCALLTTQGFRDIYEIGRVNRPESYNLFFRRHEPLIERDLRYEIRERMDAQGKVLIKLDEDAGARGGRRRGRRRASRRSPSCSCTPTAIPRTSSGSRRSSRRAIPISSSRPRTSCRRNIVSSSAPRRRRPMPMSDRGCGAISARWATISMPPASPANF